ncbi:NAD(P)-binding protein [Thozetella sp. PMI_491]|nr:NAD(P)-binding protein [Thozetella sp. PMI_491]
MAPHAELDEHGDAIVRLAEPERPAFSASPPRIMIVGGGNRGIVYAKAVTNKTNGIVIGIVEPVAVKRRYIGRKFIWGKGTPAEGQEFETWKEYVAWELVRRENAAAGQDVSEGADAVFICVADQMHRQALEDLAPLNLHIMCEKPLGPSLDDCVAIYRSLVPDPSAQPKKIFSVGHVLRYSPHNQLLRKILLEDKAIGEIMSVNHTEPVGWNHFAHSFVRGNWRKESTSAPALLAKCCHDIDILYWLLATPAPGSTKPPHIPRDISSSGSLQYFKQSWKPAEAGAATNCLSCAHEPDCQYSAKRIYSSPQMASRNQERWARIVCPELEECATAGGPEAGKEALLAKLREDYGPDTPAEEVSGRQWYGRCVYEADNDVCDNQTVTLAWEDEPLAAAGETPREALAGRGSKTATLHMVAWSKKICTRLTHVYGGDGEVYADSASITVHNFKTGDKKVHYPYVPADGGHTDADEGLSRNFVLAVDRIKNHGADVAESQLHLVFAAEEARKNKTVVDFPSWWEKQVVGKLGV